jgi:hypothetical protein
MGEFEKYHNGNLFFGLQNGELKHISEVANGLRCECICPACNKRLIARNRGSKRMHHYAHYEGGECKYGFQTSIHLVAKDILEKCGRIKVPGKSVHISVGLDDEFYNEVVSEKHDLFEEFYINIDKVFLEKKLHSFIPDVLIICGKKMLIVEIAVTHFVGREKLDKIKEARVSTIEIDLSNLRNDFNREDLESIIVEDLSLKSWLYNQYEQDLIPIKRSEMLKDLAKVKAFRIEEEKRKKKLDREIWYEKYYRKVVRRNHSMNKTNLEVENCPLKEVKSDDENKANVKVDCLNCEHSRGTRENDEFLICLYEYHMNRRKYDL